jgi:hypothetical protein
MATKIKLGSPPKNFKRIVKFPMLDGTDGAIECTYKYRSRKDFATFVDTLNAASKPVVAVATMTSSTDKMDEANAAYIFEVLDGWNLDVDLTLETARQLIDEVPAAANAIMATYAAACTEGRLGN